MKRKAKNCFIITHTQPISEIFFISALVVLFILYVPFIQAGVPGEDGFANPDFFLAANGVTVMCPDAAIGDTGVVNGITYTKRDRDGVIALLNADENNPEIATTCTSGITTMSGLFSDRSDFNQDIGSWDVSHVEDMSFMFSIASNFNSDIGDWDVINVSTMRYMFDNAESFDQNLNSWQTGNVTNMVGMFYFASGFNGNINNWDVSSVTAMDAMFFEASSFNQNLSGWCVDQIGSAPTGFDSGADAWTLPRPVWGSCPNPDFFLAANDVTVVCTDAQVGDRGTVGGTTYTKRDRDGIIALRNSDPNNPELATTCTSGITEMDGLFASKSDFDQDIGSWDVSNVTTMFAMFTNATGFNQDLPNWQTGNVENMRSMFQGATTFNGEISNWDVSNVNTMYAMFLEAASFNGDISAWHVGNVSDMNFMFMDAESFNQDLPDWQTENVEVMGSMFFGATAFNGDISSWDVSSVTNMGTMFMNAENFNQDLSSWCVDQIDSAPSFFDFNATAWTLPRPVWGTCPVVNPDFFFAPNGVTVVCTDAAVGDTGTVGGITYTKRDRDGIIALLDDDENNPEIAATCTSGITDMESLFQTRGTFNQDIGSWDVGNVTDMSDMFSGAESFNQNIGDWDVSSVTYMSNMFPGAIEFNQDIGGWDVGNVMEMRNMFLAAESFNQDIGSWDVGNVTDMSFMFFGAESFNQNIGDWDVSSVTNMFRMFRDASSFNQNLSGWCVDQIATEPSDFDTGATAWILPRPFWGTCPVVNPDFFFAPNGVTVVCTDAAVGDTGTVGGITYTKRDRAGLDALEADSDGPGLSTSCTSGIVDMSGLFDFSNVFDLDVTSWDVSSVTNMANMFREAQNFSLNFNNWDVSNVTDMSSMFAYENQISFNPAVEDWDVGNVTNMNAMFLNLDTFDRDISGWNVENVENMSSMFENAQAFNQDISGWDVSNVTTMSRMFYFASSFNQNIGGWIVESVTDMSFMFYEAGVFNQDIRSWDVQNVLTMESMFNEATNFNQDIGNWDVGNVTNMDSMFEFAESFNQNLSGWCVDQISSEPTDFDNGADDWTLPDSRPVWGTCPDAVFTASLPGPNEGWRMLGVPVAEATYGEFFANVWTQGYSGANFAPGDPNIFYFDETDRDNSLGGYVVPQASSNIIGSSANTGFDNAAHGVMAYIFADDNFDGTPNSWPKALPVEGSVFSGTINRTLSQTSGTDGFDGWHIVSNPYQFTVSWSDIFDDADTEDINANIFVWDANRDGGADYIVTSDALSFDEWDGLIAPFQGFWVQAVDDDATLSFKPSHQAATEADLLNTVENPIITLGLNSENRSTWATVIMDTDRAVQPQRYNAVRMASLTPDYLHLFTTQAEESTPWWVQYVPADREALMEIPLHVSTTESGRFTLNVETDFADDIPLRLVDRNTGEVMEINSGFSYSFDYDGSGLLSAEDLTPAEMLQQSTGANLLDIDVESRFVLLIGSGEWQDPRGELPEELVLNQNYPNPFNPSTTISFLLPQAVDVVLEVYNVLGQRVAVVLNESLQAGQHSVSFDASRMSSGTYVYRLRAGNTIISKKMTMIK